MHGLLLRLVVALLVLGSLGRVALAEMLWGVNGHPLVSYTGVTIDEQMDLIQHLGLRSYRVDVTTIDQVDRLAALVEAGRKRGVSILPVLVASDDLDTTDETTLHRDAFAFASALARRFASTIDVWELGNEMENYALLEPCEMRDDGTTYPCEWGTAGGMGPLDYYGPRYKKIAAVLRGLSEGVKEGNPAARRAIGSAGWGHLGIFDRYHADGIEWDISVWHMYGQDPEPAFQRLAAFGKPIWVTEFNHPFDSTQNEADREAGQAKGIVHWMERLKALSATYRVEAAQIYELFDEAYWAPNPEAHMGLYRLTPRPDDGGWAPDAPKPAFHAVQQFLASGNR
ncbi:glycoside hydrolase family protein [Ancylobacter sp. 6x-1]|uniref:Glycoside hydrolase family protein n=1 Tax=Ancylobacter crimeensis TaxID=2579147 RepID=A0ABT0DBC6_9HYPH|nr:glycosyl hydrolase [Ancylobacter crimeensis]MCK0197265.1 glycoside hydrolase family protein [Ancylobacter crimeensis]